jgi:hypothetical protein
MLKMKMSKLFLKANVGNAVGLVALVLSFIFSSNISINLNLIIIFIVINSCFFRIAFEYQRITLIIGRCVGAREAIQRHVLVFYIQTILASPTFSFLLFLENIFFGLLAGYVLGISFFYFVVLFVIKYLVISLIPFPIPYGLLFKIIDKQVVKAYEEMRLSGGVSLLPALLVVYEAMPHNKSYENWAYKEYGDYF